MPTDIRQLNRQEIVNLFARLLTTFYGMTHTIGNRLIARAIRTAGLKVEGVDIHDLTNPATHILQQNLYLRQPFVEFGKNLLEKRLKALQAQEAKKAGAIKAAMVSVKALARQRTAESNIKELKIPSSLESWIDLANVIQNAAAYARQHNRKFVPVFYLESDKFYSLRDYLIARGYEWVLQGTGDQHISFQQLLAQPQKYLVFIISLVPQKMQPALPAVGFAKGYLDNISPNMVRDYFAEASYRAFTEERKEQGGKAVLVRMIDNRTNLKELRSAFNPPGVPYCLDGGIQDKETFGITGYIGLFSYRGKIITAFLKLVRFAEGARGLKDLVRVMVGAVVVMTLKVKRIYVKNADIIMGLPEKDSSKPYLAKGRQGALFDGGEMQRYIENLKGLFGTQEYECVLMAIHLLDSLEQEIMQDTRKHPALWRINDRDIWQKTLHLAHQGFSLSKTFDKLAATIDLLNGGQFLEGYTRTLHIRAAIIDNADTLYMTKDKQISIIPSDFIVNRKVGESQRHYTAFNQTSSRALGLSLSAGENNPGSRQDIHTHEAEEITFSGAENIAFVDYNGLISELSLRYGFAPCSNLAKVLMRDILHAAACGKDLEDCYQGIRLNEMEKLLLKRMMEEIDIASLEERYSHQMPFGCLVRIPAGYSHTLHNTDVLAPSIDWTFKDIFTRLFRSSGEAIVSSRCAFVPARVEHGNGWSIYSHILPAMAAQLETDEEGKIIFKQDATASYNPDASLVMDVDFKIITIKPAHMTGIIPLRLCIQASNLSGLCRGLRIFLLDGILNPMAQNLRQQWVY